MAQEQERDDSIFDFLYVDRHRLGSLLAQLSDDGVITLAKRTSSQTGKNFGKFKASAGVVGGEGSVSDAATEALERQFDSTWLLPINALTVLQQSGMMVKDLSVPLGSIVHITGTLILRDIDLMKRMWEPFATAIVDEEKPNARAAQKKKMSLAGKILKELPPTVQILAKTAHGDVWGLLNGADPTFNPHFIGLKHGAKVQGNWHVIGILDAEPDAPTEHDDAGDGNVMNGMGLVIDEMRKIVGRPFSAYGITPLAIFRPCRSSPDEG